MVGGCHALRMRCDLDGHGLESPHIRMYLDASLPHAQFLGLYEILFGGKSGGRALACAGSSAWAGHATNTEVPQGN